MKDNTLTKEEVINNFIVNVSTDDAHDHVLITAQELLTEDDEFPIIHSAELFVDCLIGYFEHTENYELCADLHKNRLDIEGKLVPLGRFFTKNHETLRNFRENNDE
jgi:hypothetical protein